jgi:DNA replication protein DnaC
MNDQLDHLLTSLHLKKLRELLPQALSVARSKQPDYEDFLLPLVRAQWHERQEKALAWRIKRATLPEALTLETFPFQAQPGVARRQIQAFASLDFLAAAENIVFIGDTGVGKSGLATGLLLKALQNGYSGSFIKAQDLFDEMYASLADRSTRRFVNRLARIDLLVIDELAYINLRPEQANIFFKLVEERYRKKPIIITTNLDYEEWPNFLGNQPLAQALLSRLRHNCHTIKIKGPSLRQPRS